MFNFNYIFMENSIFITNQLKQMQEMYFINVFSLIDTQRLRFVLQVVNKMCSEVLSVQGISRVLYDLTSKPPGTTEWEWWPLDTYDQCLLNFSALPTAETKNMPEWLDYLLFWRCISVNHHCWKLCLKYFFL